MSTSVSPAAAGLRCLPSLVRVPIERLVPGPNVRGPNLGDIDGLAVSLQTLGQQVPLLVSLLPDGRYEILDGSRRYAAASRIGLPCLDAVLRRAPDEVERTLRQLAMHCHSRTFDPLVEAQAIHRLMWQDGLSREEIAAALGRSPVWVRDRLALLALGEEEKERLSKGKLTIREAVVAAKGKLAEATGRPRAHRAQAPRRSRGRAVGSPPPHCRTCRCQGSGREVAQ